MKEKAEVKESIPTITVGELREKTYRKKRTGMTTHTYIDGKLAVDMPKFPKFPYRDENFDSTYDDLEDLVGIALEPLKSYFLLLTDAAMSEATDLRLQDIAIVGSTLERQARQDLFKAVEDINKHLGNIEIVTFTHDNKFSIDTPNPEEAIAVNITKFQYDE